MRPPEPVTLSGLVVRLEPLAPAHREGLATAIAEDAAAFRYYGPTFVPGGVDGWLDVALRERAAGVRLPFAVVETARGRVVGSTSYLDIAPADGRLEIGHTWYGASAQGTTVNPEAKLLLLAHAFDVLGAVRVCLKCDARNARSRRAIAGIGGTFEGVLRKQSRRHDGTPGHRDTAFFSILDDEWTAVRARLEARLARAATVPAAAVPPAP